jgi:preprotein translocase subunit Sss1
MGILNTLFTGVTAIAVGILLGFIVAGILGFIIYGIVKLKERWQNKSN